MSLRLIYWCQSGVDIYEWRGGRLRSVAQMRAGEEEAFAAYLSVAQQHEHRLLIDTLDEDFHHESVPYVRGRDRRIVIDRKLSQLYRESPLRCAVSLGRETGGRRDERFLFSAFTNTRQLARRLARL